MEILLHSLLLRYLYLIPHLTDFIIGDAVKRIKQPLSVDQSRRHLRNGIREQSFSEHSIMVPPRSKGRITYIAPPGEYNIYEEVLELELDGKKTKYFMSHKWPIRNKQLKGSRLNY